MSGRVRRGGLVLVVPLLLGLFAMHGVQATPSPTHTGPVAVLITAASPAPTSPHSGDQHGSPAPSPRGEHAVHPGGQVCLGLLVAAVLLLLLTLAQRLRRIPLLVTRALRDATRMAPASGTRGRQTPLIYRLAVLRL